MERMRHQVEGNAVADPRTSEANTTPAPLHPLLALQRAAGNKAVTQLLRVQRAVSTWGGTWDTPEYAPYTGTFVDGTPIIGASMELRFRPNRSVDARQISLTQTAQSTQNGSPIYGTHGGGADITRGRSIPQGAGAGAHIDQWATVANPIFGTGNDERNGARTMAQWKTNDQQGWRYRDESGRLRSRSAHLWDTPQLPKGPNRRQQFETTALALSGTQRDTYYGSVRWGWEADGSGNPRLIPLSVVSRDAPSGTFADATRRWNESVTTTGEGTLDLPVAYRRWVREGAELRAAPDAPTGETLTPGTRVMVTARRAGASRATVISSPSRGRVGWIDNEFLAARAP